MNTYPYIDGKDVAIYDDPVDHMEPIVRPEQAVADIITRLMVFQLQGGDTKRIAARTMVLAQTLGIDVGDDIVTNADIAKACSVTRSAVSLMSNELRDQLGLISHNNRSEQNRKNCKNAKRGNTTQL
tara:strand:- start:111 stop:491 length:381 start_codon:yes stop_codon:yes gene_type:complete